jgi:hypothetical protein
MATTHIPSLRWLETLDDAETNLWLRKLEAFEHTNRCMAEGHRWGEVTQARFWGEEDPVDYQKCAWCGISNYLSPGRRSDLHIPGFQIPPWAFGLITLGEAKEMASFYAPDLELAVNARRLRPVLLNGQWFLFRASVLAFLTGMEVIPRDSDGLYNALGVINEETLNAKGQECLADPGLWLTLEEALVPLNEETPESLR